MYFVCSDYGGKKREFSTEIKAVSRSVLDGFSYENILKFLLAYAIIICSLQALTIISIWGSNF